MLSLDFGAFLSAACVLLAHPWPDSQIPSWAAFGIIFTRKSSEMFPLGAGKALTLFVHLYIDP